MKAATKALAENDIEAFKNAVAKLENKNGVSLFFMEFLLYS